MQLFIFLIITTIHAISQNMLVKQIVRFISFQHFTKKNTCTLTRKKRWLVKEDTVWSNHPKKFNLYCYSRVSFSGCESHTLGSLYDLILSYSILLFTITIANSTSSDETVHIYSEWWTIIEEQVVVHNIIHSCCMLHCANDYF